MNLRMSNNDLNDKPINITECIIEEYFNNLSKFQYEKAKICIEKCKENGKIWSLFQNAFLHIINGEKYYNNLLFLNQKSITKVGDKYFEPAISLLDQIAKDYASCKLSDSNSNKSNPNIYDINNLMSLNSEILQFIDFRFQMMNLFFDLKEREARQEKANIEMTLKQLIDIEERFNKVFVHPLIEPLNNVYQLETSLIKNLLLCHIAVDYRLDCIQSVVSIKEINDIFTNKLPSLNTKQSKETKGFSLFSRTVTQQRTLPAVFQWYKIYYQALLNKFSIIMFNSFQMMSFNDLNNTMLDKVDTYAKLMNYTKKAASFMTGIILDANAANIVNFKGFGYEMVSQSNNNPSCFMSSLQGIESYPLVFSHPKINTGTDKHMRNVISLINSELDQKVKYFYDHILKSTYYLCKISEYYTFFVIFELNKQENKAKTISFVQEIGDELNLRNVFLCLNSNLK